MVAACGPGEAPFLDGRGHGEDVLPIAGLWRLAVLSCAMAIGGCTLPWQQLSLPTPPPPALEHAKKTGGVPLAKVSDTGRAGGGRRHREADGSALPARRW